MTDTLFITCHLCKKQIRSTKVEDNVTLSPAQMIRWLESVIKHVKRVHQKVQP